MPRKSRERMIASSFSIDRTMLAAVQEKCLRLGLSMADIIRLALSEALREEDDSLRNRVLAFNAEQRDAE
jgi:hypothetical protein